MSGAGAGALSSRLVGVAWPGATALMTACWVLVGLAGGDGAPVSTDARGAAAAAATAAVVGAGWRPGSVRGAQLAALVLGAAPLTLAAAAGGSPGLLAVGLGCAALAALAVAAGVVREGRVIRPARPGAPGALRVRTALPAAAGCGLLAGAILVERIAATRWALPGTDPAALGMALAGAALALTAAALGPPRLWPVAVPAMALGLAAAPHLPEPEGVVAAAAAAVAAGLVAGHRPVLVLAALALAAAAFGPAEPAAGLLAAAAVLALVVQHPAAAALGLPGAAALAAVLVAAEPGQEQAALALAAAATAVLVARSAGDSVGPLLHRGLPIRTPGGAGEGRPQQPVDGAGPRRDAGLAPEALPALALAGWLVMAPGSWTWTGRLDLQAYDRGVAVAAAAGGLALVTAWALGAARPPVARRPSPAAAPPGTPPRGARLRARRSRAGRRSAPRRRPLRKAVGGG